VKFPKPSAQPPSTVYWNALATWGILRPRPDARAISRMQAHRLLSLAKAGKDDDGQPLVSYEPPLGSRTKKISSTFYLAVVVLPAIFSSRSSSTYRQWV
jgi:hypothetical protein